MKIDLYTKILLTIIAGCLVWQTVRPIVIPTTAGAGPAIVNVNIEKVGGRAVYKVLPVAIVE